MKAFTTAGLILVLTATTAFGQIVGDDTSPIRSRVPTTLKYLNARIAQVAFEDAELSLVLDWLSSVTDMQIVVRWQILEDAGVERDKPISMQVSNLRLSQVLWLLMQEAGGSDLKLAYRASGPLLLISTAEDLGKEMVVRVYDVSDLLVRAPRFSGAPHMDLQNAQNMGTTGSGGGQSIFGGTGSGGSGRDEDDEGRGGNRGEDDAGIQELITLIVQTVEPDSWADNGGLGTIQAFRKLLVVRNNILVHQALGGYVEESE
jgi:hypothetical protein